MSIKKVIKQDGQTVWEVYSRVMSRGGQRIRRRFEKKIDAQNYLNELNQRAYQLKTSPSMAKIVSDIEIMKFQDEANYWLKMKGPEFAPGYWRAIGAGFNLVTRLYGHFPLSRMTPDLLMEYRAYMREKGLSVSTQNRYTDLVCRILSFSMDQGRIAYNPTKGFKKLKEPKVEMTFWSEEEITSFLEYASKRYPIGTKERGCYIAYLFLLTTGVRARELWGLKVADINLTQAKIPITKQLHGKDEFRPTKGKETRFVPFAKKLLDELEAWLSLFPKGPEETLFQSESKTPIDHDNFVKRVFLRDVKEAKMKKIRFHDLRHSALTLMIKKGASLAVVQRIAGHEDIKTTMRYLHVVDQDIEEVGQRFSL